MTVVGKNFLLAPAFVLLMALGSTTVAAQGQEPLRLSQAARIALENHPLMRASAAEVDAAHARYEQTRAGFFPRVWFEEGFTRGNNPVYVFGTLLTQNRFTQRNFDLAGLNRPTPLDNFQTRLNLSLRLFDSGRTELTNKQAKLSTRLADADAERTRQELLLRVVRAYYEVVVARAQVRVAEDSVRTAQSNLDRAQAKFDAGLVVESDVLSARVQRAAMQQEAIRARNRAEVAAASLNFELGVAEGTAYELPDNVAEPQPLATALAELQEAALAERPDFQESELARAIAEKGSAIARSSFGPTLSLYANWEADNPGFAAGGGSNWFLGTKLELNLFNGGADRARLAEARAQERRVEALKALMASRIRLDVRQAYLDLDAARQHVEVTRATAAEAAESLRIIQDRYDAGLTTMTDLLRAQTDLHRARTGHLAALGDWQIDHAVLEHAAGRLRPGSPVLEP